MNTNHKMKVFGIYNRNSNELLDTVIATKVRDDGKSYDFFLNNLFVSKVNKRNNYYKEVDVPTINK